MTPPNHSQIGNSEQLQVNKRHLLMNVYFRSTQAETAYPNLAYFFNRFKADSTIANHAMWRGLPTAWILTPELAHVALSQGLQAIDSLPEEVCTKSNCLKAIAKNLTSAPFAHVPQAVCDNKFRLEAVSINGLALKDIDFEAVAQEARQKGDENQEAVMVNLCKAAIKQNGHALAYVPESLHHHIPELAWHAVRQNGLALKHVPPSAQNKELYELALSQNGEGLQYVPCRQRTRSLCLIAIEQTAKAVTYIPSAIIDEDPYLFLCREHEYLVDYFREHMKTKANYLKALSLNGESLKAIPEQKQDYDICLAAVKQNGNSLKYVTNRLKNYVICQAAVSQNGSALMDVPDSALDYSICLAAVSNDGSAIKKVPQHLMDPEICYRAVQSQALTLGEVPIDLRDRTLCEEAVKIDGDALGYVPHCLRDKKLCRIAVNSKGSALQFVPEHLKSWSVCATALSTSQMAARWLPRHYQTPEMALIALKNHQFHINYFEDRVYTAEFVNEAINICHDQYMQKSVFNQHTLFSDKKAAKSSERAPVVWSEDNKANFSDIELHLKS